MDICLATVADVNAIAQIHVQSWQHAYKEILPSEFLSQLSTDKRESMWRASIANAVPDVLVAKIQNIIIGFIAIGPSRDNDANALTAEIWAIYLAASSWSQGIGSALWYAAKKKMLVEGMQSVSLWVISSNQRAIKFYSSVGFFPGTVPLKEVNLGGVKVNEARYIQKLVD